jgi:hypothetical protein
MIRCAMRCAAIVAALATADPSAQSLSREELITHPYFLMHGRAARAETSPFTIPQGDAAWVRTAARKDGASIAESALLHIPR